MGRTRYGLAAGPAVLRFAPVLLLLLKHDEGAIGAKVRSPLRHVRLGCLLRQVVRGDGILVAVAVVRDDQIERLLFGHIICLPSVWHLVYPVRL